MKNDKSGLDEKKRTMLQIGPIKVWTPVILAPMAGVTNAPFRKLCRLEGEKGLPLTLKNELQKAKKYVDAPSGLYVSEMVTTRALVERVPETMRMVKPDEDERVRSIQLYGVDPDTVYEAVKILCVEDRADHIDLNFGCPVPKVTRKGGGAALPWKKDLFENIVKNAVLATEEYANNGGKDIPVTVKMRIGIDDDHITCFQAAKTSQNNGVSAVTLHARTAKKYYSGNADWEYIARLKDDLSIPVLGNGDVFTGQDAINMMEQTGCDGVVIGRGCQGRPWLFTDIVNIFHGSSEKIRPTLAEVAEMILEHSRLMITEFGDENKAMREMRKHIGWYLRGFSVGGKTRHSLQLVSTYDELKKGLYELDLSQPYPPIVADGPRGRIGTEKQPHLPEGWLDSPYFDEKNMSEIQEAELDVSGG